MKYMKAYHMSPKKLRKTIMEEGLKPVLGPRSKRFGEIEPKLFFTKDLNNSIKLLENRRFNAHPDFKNGIDIWEIKIPDNCKIENDSKSDIGYFTKEIIGTLDADLVRSFEWMDRSI
jgi:hypothetical protein